MSDKVYVSVTDEIGTRQIGYWGLILFDHLFYHYTYFDYELDYQKR